MGGWTSVSGRRPGHLVLDETPCFASPPRDGFAFIRLFPTPTPRSGSGNRLLGLSIGAQNADLTPLDTRLRSSDGRSSSLLAWPRAWARPNPGVGLTGDGLSPPARC